MSELVELLSRGYVQDSHFTLDEVNRASEILSNSPECASDVSSREFVIFYYCRYDEGSFRPLFSMIFHGMPHLKSVTLLGIESEANLRDLADIFGPGSSRPASLDKVHLGVNTSIGAQTIKGLLAIQTKTLELLIRSSLTKEAWSILADFQQSNGNDLSHSLQLQVNAYLSHKELRGFVQSTCHTNLLIDHVELRIFDSTKAGLLTSMANLVKHRIKTFHVEITSEDAWPNRQVEFSTVFLPALKENTTITSFNLVGRRTHEPIPLAHQDQQLIDFCLARNRFLSEEDVKWCEWVPQLQLFTIRDQSLTLPAVYHIVRNGLAPHLLSRNKTNQTGVDNVNGFLFPRKKRAAFWGAP